MRGWNEGGEEEYGVCSCVCYLKACFMLVHIHVGMYQQHACFMLVHIASYNVDVLYII